MKESRLVLAAVAAGIMAFNAAPATLKAASVVGANKIPVTANVPQKCTLGATSVVGFGDYDPTAVAALNASGSFAIQCTKGTIATITFDDGENSIAAGQKRMTSDTLATAEFLNYSLAVPVQTNITLPGGVVTYQKLANSTPSTITVDGTLPPLQDVSVDTYSDNVEVTVTF